MKLKLGIIGYVPPPQFGCAQVFLANLKANRPRADLLLYSDHDYSKEDWFKFVRLKASPEVFKSAQHQVGGRPNEFAMNNAIWITGMHFAVKEGYTHIIYIESDCRFGEIGWDVPMWEEAFHLGKPVVAAGSMVIWNPALSGMDGMKKWESVIAENALKSRLAQPESITAGRVKSQNFPIPTYGFGTKPAGYDNPAVFPNGALGIYDMAWMNTLVDVTNTLAAVRSMAWDFLIGDKIWKVFGLQSYDVVHHLTAAYSTYGDQITSEAERLQMLRDRQCTAVHQVKSNATI